MVLMLFETLQAPNAIQLHQGWPYGLHHQMHSSIDPTLARVRPRPVHSMQLCLLLRQTH